LTRIGTVVFALALVVVACGDSTSGDTTSTTATAATAAPVESTTTSTAAVAVPATAPSVDWFAPLALGSCFDDVWIGDDFDFSVPPSVVPCDSLHDNEVVAMVALADGSYPGEDALTAAVEAECEIEYSAFFGGSDRALEFVFAWNVFPDEDDWANGSRVAACVTYVGEPVAGTASSAGLTAPGEVLAVIHEIDGNTDFWTLDGGTGELLVNVSQDDLSSQLAPAAWSLDGASILYTSGADEVGRRIYGGSPDGEAPLKLNDLEIDSIGSPATSPVDERVFAYIAAPGGGEFDVFVYDGNTNTSTQLTDSLDRDSTPNWSPDGTRIAFRARADDNSDVWVMDADGSNKTRLTTDPAFDGDPRWSPDGSRLLFTSQRTGDYEIWVMDADGTNQRNLTNHAADDEYPTWSPDGALIAFHSSRHGGISLWLMNADGSDQSNLSWSAPVGYPTFRP
jgi:Tol biopolymer transport system component